MAFDINSFKAITQYGQDTPDLFIYSSPDALSPVSSLHIVNSNTGGVVDVTDGLVITATDTD